MAPALARRPTLGAAIGLLVVAAGARVGAVPLGDNSFLTHLATGRLIWDGQGIPRSDPYTFTSGGEPWVVQSWLASVVYGAAEELAGLDAIRYVNAAALAALAGLAWVLTRGAGDVLSRVLVAVPVLLVIAIEAVGRPYVFALVALAVAIAAGEGLLSPRWLLLAGWIWVNTHGSWPLGLLALAVLALGRRLDGENPAVELGALRWLGAGMAAAVLNPFGVRLLLFPLDLVARQDLLARIVEWQAPTFVGLGERAFLGVVVLAIVAVRRVPAWRSTLPVVVFVPLALLGARNVLVACVVLLPSLARGLAGLGTIDPANRDGAGRAIGAVAVVALALVPVSIATTDSFDDEPYPVAADRWMGAHGVAPTEVRVVAQDFVGNWFEARYGVDAAVFIDDRVEVRTRRLSSDYRDLLDGTPGWEEALDRARAEVVLWERDRPLAELLLRSDGWERTYRDDRFVVFQRRAPAN